MHRGLTSRNDNVRSAFTLIELLVVIAIVALLVAILMPSLQVAREKGKTAVCLANLRSIMASTQMYMENDNQRLIQWYRSPPVSVNGVTPNLLTPWVFGGTMGTGNLVSTYKADSQVYPAEMRPLNKYIAPNAVGKEQIGVYRCPGDRTFKTSIIGQANVPPESEAAASSYTENGSSYTLNTRFMQGYAFETSGSLTFTLTTANLTNYPKKIAVSLNGGKASRFIMWPEQGFYAATYRAAPTLTQSLASPRRLGWHREFSRWAVAKADGSAEYAYFDTRVSRSNTWTIWEPK